MFYIYQTLDNVQNSTESEQRVQGPPAECSYQSYSHIPAGFFHMLTPYTSDSVLHTVLSASDPLVLCSRTMLGMMYTKQKTLVLEYLNFRCIVLNYTNYGDAWRQCCVPEDDSEYLSTGLPRVWDISSGTLVLHIRLQEPFWVPAKPLLMRFKTRGFFSF